jgi:hypothetical protein
MNKNIYETAIKGAGAAYAALRKKLQDMDSDLLKSYYVAEFAGAQKGEELDDWPNTVDIPDDYLAGLTENLVREKFGDELDNCAFFYLCVATYAGLVRGYLKRRAPHQLGLFEEGESLVLQILDK